MVHHILHLVGDDGLEYELDQHSLIGRGGSGKVWKGKVSETGEVVAIKQFRSKGKDEIRKEFEIIQKLRNVRGVVKGITLIENTKNNCYLHVLEHCSGGNLLQYITNDLQSYALLSKREEIINSIFKQTLLSVDQIHHTGLVHRDLKPENILLSSDGLVKICDFGIATMANIKDEDLVICKGRCGSEPYMAPEEFGHQYYEGRPVDMWALGVIYYNLIFSTAPWPKASCEIFHHRQKDAQQLFKRATHVQQLILSNLLEINPSKRWTTAKVMEVDGFKRMKVIPIPFVSLSSSKRNSNNNNDTTSLAHWTTTL